MESVRAKFKVNSKTETEGGAFKVEMTPVTSGSEENDKFFKWTPGGHTVLQTVNELAAHFFCVGREYYLDFSLADDSE